MLTTQQKATLKAYILADPILASKASGETQDFDQLRNLLNAKATPIFVVWRTSVDPNEIMRNGMDWTRVDNLSIGKARIWEWMTRLGEFNPSHANIRAGIDATWIGTAPDLAVRATVYTYCKRAALLVEKVFATGTGTTGAPAVLSFEGTLELSDIGEVLA